MVEEQDLPEPNESARGRARSVTDRWMRSVPSVPLRYLLSLFLLIASLGGVAAQPDARSTFQARLETLGIPLKLPPGKAILVNIPAFELIAFEDGEPVLRSRVIVGAPWHRTPRIDTHVSRVTFRPSWRPTPSMVARGEYADRVRPPGPDNPLGLAAVRLEPGLLIHLHDTNQRHLFAERDRALSHGCVRVQRWDALIAWILDRDVAWVREMAEHPPTKEVPAEPIPVLIRYLTVFPDADGAVIRHPDVYDLAADAAASDGIRMAAAHSCLPARL
jgi:murein L,D-transpeptidase YcbB/YkuD